MLLALLASSATPALAAAPLPIEEVRANDVSLRK